MGASHPIAWYHRYDVRRAWYTALGHTAEINAEFRTEMVAKNGQNCPSLVGLMKLGEDKSRHLGMLCEISPLVRVSLNNLERGNIFEDVFEALFGAYQLSRRRVMTDVF
jgi:hypothetical protein